MFSQNGGGGRAGLGLAIAKAFVEAHGGLIWIDPEVAHGRPHRLHRPGGDPRRGDGLRVCHDQGTRRRRRSIAAQGTADRPDGPRGRSARRALGRGGRQPGRAGRSGPGHPRPRPARPRRDGGLPSNPRSSPRCPSSCCPPTATSAARSRPSTAGPTTSSRSPSAWPNSRRGCGWRCATLPPARTARDEVHDPERRRPRHRSGPPHGDAVGRAAAADGQRVRAPGLPGPPRRQGVHPPHDPQGRLGSRVRRRVQLRPRLHPPAAQEDGRRGGPDAQDHPGHRVPAGRRTLIRRRRTNRAGCASRARRVRVPACPRRRRGDPATMPGHTGAARRSAGPSCRCHRPGPASVRTQGRSKEATDRMSPATRDRCRGTNAAMAVAAHLMS